MKRIGKVVIVTKIDVEFSTGICFLSPLTQKTNELCMMSLCVPDANAKTTGLALPKFAQNLYFKPELMHSRFKKYTLLFYKSFSIYFS